MYISETKIVVRYAETDKMGIVHHSNYFIWFEAGRTDFIKGSHISYSEMEENGILIPLAESNCKYIIGAKYEDELIIKTWVKQLTPVKVEFNYSVIRENDQREIAKGSTLHIFLNNDFRIINLKKVKKEIFDKLESLI
ncbi:acyl-CoA thioesterase [Clostridium beijerinckii]|uniref:acyl-CoA thioesterase n=1 Tax=Clostridium beijerinckii TaxID=1520 RepID=UPI00047A618A|nr:thioesterase family protein [Clostridium beijerinckii]